MDATLRRSTASLRAQPPDLQAGRPRACENALSDPWSASRAPPAKHREPAPPARLLRSPQHALSCSPTPAPRSPQAMIHTHPHKALKSERQQMGAETARFRHFAASVNHVRGPCPGGTPQRKPHTCKRTALQRSREARRECGRLGRKAISGFTEGIADWCHLSARYWQPGEEEASGLHSIGSGAELCSTMCKDSAGRLRQAPLPCRQRGQTRASRSGVPPCPLPPAARQLR